MSQALVRLIRRVASQHEVPAACRRFDSKSQRRRGEQGLTTTGIVVAIVLVVVAVALGLAAHPLFFALIVLAIILLFVL